MAKLARAPAKDSYNEAVKTAKLLDIRLTESNWAFDLSMLREIDSLEKYTDQSIPDEPHLSPENGRLIGNIVCSLMITPNLASYEAGADTQIDASQAAVFCKAKYLVAFDVPKTFTQGDANKFFESTAKFAVWPYFRSLVANLAAQSRLELPPLPLTTLLQRIKGDTP
jgi:hypothetical protein